jgi:predicted TIM-barrel fold metal-dependent hydrolase
VGSSDPLLIPPKLISADCHVEEPPDLWSERLPREYRDRGPRVERRDGATAIVVEDTVARRFKLPEGSGDTPTFFHHVRGPEQRLQELDADGVWGEVMYPNLAFFCVYSITDPALQHAVCATYNDWMAETYLASSPRFCPVALLPSLDIGAVLAELERAAGLGLRAAMLPVHSDTRPYNDASWEPVWSAAAAHGLPLSFHAGTGRSQTPAHGPGAAVVNYVVTVGSAFEAVSYLCGSGVLARHPDLRVVMAESGSGWLAWTLHAMDDAYREHAGWVQPKLDELPSEYFRRQGSVTFQHDPIGLAAIPFTGDRCLMWGSDYPHPEGTWPHSAEYLARQFDGIDDAVRARVTCANAKELYRFAVS